MKNISVIIVSWNARAYLRDCLISLRETSAEVVCQIIVVDNASNDGSPEMVAAEFPEVCLIQTGANLGFARANNLGIKQASGSYLAFVNSDVVIHQGCFNFLLECLESNPNVGLVGPEVFGGDGKVQPTCRRLPTLWSTAVRALALDTVLPRHSQFSQQEVTGKDERSPQEVDVLSGCFWLARREAVDQVGGLDERFFFYAEDVDWCKRFRDGRWKVMFVPAAHAIHFGGGSSANAPFRYSIELLRANLIYWKKHRGLLGQAAFYALSVLHHSIRLASRSAKFILSKANKENTFKLTRSYICLRWLLTGKKA